MDTSIQIINKNYHAILLRKPTLAIIKKLSIYPVVLEYYHRTDKDFQWFNHSYMHFWLLLYYTEDSARKEVKEMTLVKSDELSCFRCRREIKSMVKDLINLNMQIIQFFLQWILWKSKRTLEGYSTLRPFGTR